MRIVPVAEAIQTALQALREATAAGAQHGLAWLGTPLQRHDEWLQHPGGFVAEVHLDCTALWPAVVLVGVLVLFGSVARVGAWRLLWAAVLGVGVMALVNQLRLVGTLWLGVHAPALWPLVHEWVGPLGLVAAGAGVVVAMVKGLPPGGRRPLPRSAAVAVVLAAAGPGLAGLIMPAPAAASAPASSAAARPGGAGATVAVPPVVSGVGARAGAPMVSGDLIVKFRDASEPGSQLAAVLAGQRTVASVAPLAARLSAELGVPLALVQVTSGREALLALDRAALARVLLERAGREAAVRHAALAPSAASGLPGAELVLRLETHRNTAPATRDALAGRLGVGNLARPRITAVEGAADTVSLRYDIDALTLALIARLQQRPEVEYVQANRLLRPSPGGGGASGTPR